MISDIVNASFELVGAFIYSEGKVMTVWRLVHHCIAHPLMGLFDHPITHKFHDWTARKAFSHDSLG